MTPYYDQDGITLYLGDCREVTGWLKADVLVTDPPYGLKWDVPSYNGGKGHPGIANDSDASARDAVLRLWGTRPSVVFGSPVAPMPLGVKQVLVWQKPPDTGIFGCVGGFRRDWEAVYLLGRWPGSKAERTSVLRSAAPSLVSIVAARYPNYRGTGHPHTKPLDLMSGLVTACPPGVVADPFAGSGSTLLAARSSGRRAIGVEVDERYCEIIASRLAQGDLFGGVA